MSPDPARPTPRSVLPGHLGSVTTVAFSPDGHTLASGSTDQTIRLWNVTDPSHPVADGPQLAAAARDVTTVAFSPDGHLLASGSADQTIQLWNVTDPTKPTTTGQPMTTFGGSGLVAGFSPNGRYLVSADAADTVRLTDLDVDDAIGRICAVTRAVLTPAQWQTHLPNLPYQPPCAASGTG